jgi:mannose-1-phosphate guanylyltransferase/mannose-6-phosphate isomerase
MVVIPVILAGGSGTRLWPLSRELFPKQFLSIIAEHTLLQSTVLRLYGLEDVIDPVVICNENHRFLIAEQFRAIDTKAGAIILEPIGKNTAPAVTLAALHALTIADDPVLLILPADHYIKDSQALRKAIGVGAHFAEKGNLITFGIIPGSPETGYGYIRIGERVSSDHSEVAIFKSEQFVEKPNLETAQGYLDSGDYLWNSGMFMFLASQIIGELSQFSPQIVDACRAALDKGARDLDFLRIDTETFLSCPSDSIDYAVMEKTRKGLIVPLSVGWNDLGSWNTLLDVGDKDEYRNVTAGDVLIHDVRNSYVHATSRLVVAIGVEDHIIVETSDAVMIASRDRVQDIKALVNKLKALGREEAFAHKRVFRPWGSYESINLDNRFQVKRITVKPGAKLSFQKHFHRAEHWVVVQGTALVTRGDEQLLLKEDESTYIPLGVNHRLENPGKIPLELIEVQTGSYLGEDDIVRYDDSYGRV